MRIKLKNGISILIDPIDADLFKSRNWGFGTGGVRSTDGCSVLAARVIARRKKPEMQWYARVSFKNGNRLDLRRKNLLPLLPSLSLIRAGAQRLRRSNTSGVTGVSRDTNTGNWVAKIGDNWRTKHLGCYATKAAAIAARKAAERELLGSLAP